MSATGWCCCVLLNVHLCYRPDPWFTHFIPHLPLWCSSWLEEASDWTWTLVLSVDLQNLIWTWCLSCTDFSQNKLETTSLSFTCNVCHGCLHIWSNTSRDWTEDNNDVAFLQVSGGFNILQFVQQDLIGSKDLTSNHRIHLHLCWKMNTLLKTRYTGFMSWCL